MHKNNDSKKRRSANILDSIIHHLNGLIRPIHTHITNNAQQTNKQNKKIKNEEAQQPSSSRAKIAQT